MKAVYLIPLLFLGQQPQNQITKYESSWDCVTQDVEGNPKTVAFYEVAYAPPIVDIRLQPQLAVMRKVPVSEAARPEDACGYSLTEWLKDIRQGTFNLYVRAYDAAGNVGDWSQPAVFSLDKIPPGQVRNVKVKVVIEIQTQ